VGLVINGQSVVKMLEEPQPLELPSFEFSNDSYRAVVLACRSIA